MGQEAVIHDERPGEPHIEREFGRDPDHPGAAGEHGWRQRPLFPPEHIGRRQRMAEARQVNRVLRDLDPHQRAADGQIHLRHIVPCKPGHMVGGFGRIGPVDLADLCRRIHGEHKARAEGVGRAEQRPQIHGFRDFLRPDPEKSAHGRFSHRRDSCPTGQFPARRPSGRNEAGEHELQAPAAQAVAPDCGKACLRARIAPIRL